MPKALRNSTFTDFLRQYGLDLHSVDYVSAEYRPGIQTHSASSYCCSLHICLVYMTVTVCHSLGVLLRAGMSTLQQAAAFGYPSAVYMIRSKDTSQKLPPWAWVMVALGALGMLIAGELLPQGSK